MAWKILHQHEKKLFNFPTFRELFQLLTTTLLSLLLPLSFLLLARLTTARYLLGLNFNLPSKPINALLSVVLYTNPTLLHGIVSIVTVSTLVHALSNNDVGIVKPTTHQPIARPSRIYAAWIFLCTLQVIVGLGIEGSIGAGIDHSSNNGNYKTSLFSRAMFFLGLHETMLHWTRKVVKPVVDDTVYGARTEERWVGRMLMAASFSGLWWWRLKDEVESLVVVAEVKRELVVGVGVEDFLGWWLYYLTVTIGMVRVVKGFVWAGMVLFMTKAEENVGKSCENDAKV